MNHIYLLILGIIFIVINTVLFTKVSKDIKLIILVVMVAVTFGILGLANTSEGFQSQVEQQVAENEEEDSGFPEECSSCNLYLSSDKVTSDYKADSGHCKEILFFMGSSDSNSLTIPIEKFNYRNHVFTPEIKEIKSSSMGRIRTGSPIFENSGDSYDLQILNSLSNDVTGKYEVSVKKNDRNLDESITFKRTDTEKGWEQNLVIRLKLCPIKCGIINEYDQIMNCSTKCWPSDKVSNNGVLYDPWYYGNGSDTYCETTAELKEGPALIEELSQNIKCYQHGNPYENEDLGDGGSFNRYAINCASKPGCMGCKSSDDNKFRCISEDERCDVMRSNNIIEKMDNYFDKKGMNVYRVKEETPPATGTPTGNTSTESSNTETQQTNRSTTTATTGLNKTVINNVLFIYNNSLQALVNADNRNESNRKILKITLDTSIMDFVGNYTPEDIKKELDNILIKTGIDPTEVLSMSLEEGSVIIKVSLKQSTNTESISSIDVNTLFIDSNPKKIEVAEIDNTPMGFDESNNQCPSTSSSINIDDKYSQVKEDVVSMLQIFSLDELNILHKIILLSDLNGERAKDLNKAIDCLSKIDVNGLNKAKTNNSDSNCDIYLNTLTTYSEIVSKEALFYSVAKILRVLKKIGEIDSDTYKAGRYLFDIVNSIEDSIHIINSGVHQKSIHSGISPKNYDLDDIFKKPEMNNFGTELINKLDQLLNKDKQHLKCDIPNSPYPAVQRPPKCIPQTKCNDQPVGIINGGSPGSVLNYTGVGSIMPKFAYTELYDPQYYN
jgi:hypothetical protein